MRNLKAASWSASVTIIFLTLLILAADLFPPIKTWLKESFGHHWVGKGWLGIGLFLTLWLVGIWVTRETSEEKTAMALAWLTKITLAAAVILVGFFVLETFR